MQAFTWPIWVLLAVPDYQTLPPEFTLLILVFAVGNFPFAILSSFLFGVNVWNRLKEEWKRHSNHTEQTKLRDYQQP